MKGEASEREIKDRSPSLGHPPSNATTTVHPQLSSEAHALAEEFCCCLNVPT